MAGKLEGKIALITGGSSGIGRAAAKLFAVEGAEVVICARTEENLQSAVGEIREAGGRAEYFVCDVQSDAQVKAMFEEVGVRYGHLDILMNNAGRMDRLLAVGNADEDITRDVFETNVLGPIRVTREAWRLFAGKGVIVNVSSLSAFHGIGGVAYTTSKYGLITLTQHCAAMGMEADIRANAICPGSVNTTLNTPEDVAAFDMECLGMLMKHSAATDKICEPEDVANAALFFASEDSRAITGQVVYLDWGSSL